MDRQSNLLQLVSFARGLATDDLCRLLQELGYEIRWRPASDWLLESSQAADRSTVLFLSGNGHDRHQLLSRLRRGKQYPCVAVIPDHEPHWDPEVLECCDEFVSWPCRKDEIAMRLARLGTCSRPALVTRTAAARDIEEFISLNMVGSSLAFQNVVKQIKKVAASDAPVLIEGETGTGKELAARAIHYLGGRRDYPFIPVNCGAIPDNLLENELFGHEKGAFTDARKRQAGILDQADQGTLFLDEVEAFSPKGQVVLLRFLQDQRYQPLGGSSYKQADVRVIAACNTKLHDLVRRGGFRLDLYYRLYIMSIEMPPLRRRENDIWELTKHFMGKLMAQYNQPDKHLHPEAIAWMRKYRWPGNVRELENLLHREFLMAENSAVKLGGTSSRPALRVERRKNVIDRRQGFLLDVDLHEAKTRLVSQFEKNYLTQLLNESDGNVTVAARRAGKERRAFGKLLKKHGITKDL